jgi:tripartite-type tricarboxylate transporter receptor subunit TctC
MVAVSRLIAFALIIMSAASWEVSAQTANFAGKKVSVMVGFSPGGIGYDTYGRVLARHMPRHLAGAPTMVVENKPGAGSMTLTNFIYNGAPRDGTAIGLIGRGVPMDPILRGTATSARFDATKFGWIGSMNNEVAGFFIRKGAPAQTLDEILAGRTIDVGSAGAGSDMQIFATVLNSVLRTRLNIVSGYPGMNEIAMAMMRGEADGAVGYSWGTARVGSREQLQSGEFKIVMQLALKKHPELPNVPLVLDLVKNDADRDFLNLIFARQAMGRPLVAPPGLEPAVLEALRKAFADTMKDPEFMNEANKVGLEIEFVSGQEVENLVKQLYALPKEIFARAQEMMSR